MMRRIDPSDVFLAACLCLLFAPGAAGAGDYLELKTDEQVAAEQSIKDILHDKVSFQFTQTPLIETLRDLKGERALNILVDFKSLEDSGVPSDAPITLEMKDVTLRSALNQLLQPLDLTWTIRDESVVVLTKERADSDIQTRVYLVADLKNHGDEAGEFDSLLRVITSVVEPNSWDSVGGPGSIRSFGYSDALVCSQTHKVHEQIQQLLEKLRQAHEQQSDRSK